MDIHPIEDHLDEPSEDDRFYEPEDDTQQEAEDPGFDFEDDLFGAYREPRPRLTRAQKRADGLVRTGAVNPLPESKSFSKAQVQNWRRLESLRGMEFY